MPRLAACQRLGDQLPRTRRMRLGPRLGQHLLLALQLEAEVLEAPDEQQWPLLAATVELQRRRAAGRVAPDEVARELRSLDARPRIAEPVGEVA